MKRIVRIFLICICALFTVAVQIFAAQTDSNMNIYALYLPQEGDAVLLESQGQWMLVDTGIEASAEVLLQKLSAYGVEELDVLITHLHSDHTGGFAALADSDIRINRLLLPAAELTSYDENTSQKQNQLTQKAKKNYSKVEIIHLEKGDAFSLGAVNASVLGPVADLTPADFADTETQTAVEKYVNCRSLTVRFDCGGVSYLCAGDIEQEEELALVREYEGTDVLNADILKLSHHALYTSNTEEFLQAVSPRYSFALNTNKTISEGSDYRMYYASCKNASRYGPVYLVGDEKADFKVKTANGKVDIYKADNELKGLVTLAGGDGTVVKTYKYYITGDTVEEGVYTIDGQKYYVSQGGFVNKAFYSHNLGKYVYRYEPEEGGAVRYFDLEGVMYTGFRKINEYYFYFDTETGVLLKGDENYTPVVIGAQKYAVNENGVVYNYGADTGAWKQYGENYRYFGTDGVMRTGWLAVNDKKYYMDPDTGLRTVGLQELDGKTYYFVEKNNAGYAWNSGWKNFEGSYRYFDVDGVMKTGWLKVNGKKYYLNKTTGFRTVGLKKIGDKTYYFVETDDAAYAWCDGWKKFDGNYRYFDTDGVMKTGWLTVGEKKYYMDPSTGLRTVGLKEIDGKTYYFVEKNNAGYAWCDGWKSFDGNYRYFDADGVMLTGWQTINGKEYYLSKTTGLRKTGFVKDDGKYYYVKGGRRSNITGFVEYDGAYYQLEKGVRVTSATYVKCGETYVRLSKTTYVYNGEVRKPSVKIYDEDGNKISSKHYSVTYSSGRKNVGKYKVTVKLKGDYSGSKSLYFKIKPAGTEIDSISAGTGSLTVNIVKRTKQVTGYQVQYATSKSFETATKKTVSSDQTTKVKLTGLKSGKTYYVRVRTYMTVDDTKYYSEWSDYVAKKTK